MKIHFYWSGDNWQFLNRMTIVSHVIAGHTPIMWLNGDRPKSKYWIDDISGVEIRDANEVFDTNDLINRGVDIRTTSDKFSYYVVQKTGDYYADTDAIAILPWPDQDIVLATYEPKVINVGVFRLPKNHPVLDDCISTHIPRWGNVWMFTKAIRNAGLDYNVPINMFYPVHCENNISTTMGCRGKFLDDIKLPDGCVSYHYWSNKVSLVNITHEWMDNPKLKDSLFKRLCDQMFNNTGFTITNEGSGD